MAKKKQQRKDGIAKPLNVTAPLHFIAPPPKKKPEEQSADKQGLEEGKAAAGKVVSKGVSTAEQTLERYIKDNGRKNTRSAAPETSRAPGKQKKAEDGYPQHSSNAASEKEAEESPFVSTPEREENAFRSVPSTRDDDTIKVRKPVHQSPTEERPEDQRFVERQTNFREESPELFQEQEGEKGMERKREQEDFPAPKSRDSQKAERIISQDEKEIPAVNYMELEEPSIFVQEPVKENCLSDVSLYKQDTRLKENGTGLDTKSASSNVFGRKSNSDRSEGSVRTRSADRSVRSRTGNDSEFSKGGQKVKTSGKEERFTAYSKQAETAIDTAEKAKEAGQAAGEAARTAGEAAKTAGEAAEGASSGGISIAVQEFIKKTEESFHAIHGNENSPMGNDHSQLISVFSFIGGIGAILLSLLGVVIIPVLLAAAVIFFFSSAGNQGLSDDVVSWMPQIQAACIKYEIPNYAPLAAAIMMQESGGNADLVNGDLMECAEGMGLPVGTPVEPEESIDFGVKLIAGLLKQAQVVSPADMDHLKLAVQAYNFGAGYISYALARDGKYTKENAIAFADRQAASLGWSSYGDVDYVDHVLRYYTVSAVSGAGGASARYPNLCYPMEGYTWTTYSGHEGIDIPCDVGTPVYASAGGTVGYVKNGWTEADGKNGMMSYGNCVCISHGAGLETRYGHLAFAVVSSGQTVLPGQLIGYSGNTGNSTGPHMHFAIYENGSPGSGGYSNNAALAFPNMRQ